MYGISQNVVLNLYICKLLNRDKNNLLQMAHSQWNEEKNMTCLMEHMYDKHKKSLITFVS